MSFADLELVRQGVRLEPLLHAICNFLDKQPALVDRVRRDLVRGLKQPDHGRRGLTAPRTIPDEFRLRTPLGDRRSCRVIWRTEDALGVEFIGLTDGGDKSHHRPPVQERTHA